jgi:high affinity sulfate transporter 1
MKLTFHDFKNHIPITIWLPKYQRNLLRADIVSGITVWGVIVPAAMAFSELAGLPPQAGLYAAFAGMITYALFSTSRHLKVTASSTMAIMSAAIVADLGSGGDMAKYAALSAMLALAVGGIILLAGVVKLGFISDFLSKPVITGFLFGVSLDIIVGQAPKLFGVSSGTGNLFQRVSQLIFELNKTNPWTLGIGFGSLLLIFILKRYLRRIPAGLVVLIIGIVISFMLKLSERGVSVVGSIPMSLPVPAIPSVSVSDLTLLIAGAGGIVFLAVGESVGAARGFASRHHYDINPDQELIALGMANISAGLFQGFTVDASMSATTTGEEAGAQTQLSSVISSIMILATLAVLAPLFATLPNAVLGAIVISAVSGLLDVGALKRFYQEYRIDFWIALIALVGVITVDLVSGLLIAVFLSVVVVVYIASRPHLAVLGSVPTQPNEYSDVTHHPEVKPIPGLLILRVDAPLFFANANIARSHVLNVISSSKPPPKAVLFDISSSSTLDITSIDMLKSLVSDLNTAHIDLLFAHVRTPVREKLRLSGLLDKVGENHIYLSIDSAVQDFLTQPSK